MVRLEEPQTEVHLQHCGLLWIHNSIAFLFPILITFVPRNSLARQKPIQTHSTVELPKSGAIQRMPVEFAFVRMSSDGLFLTAFVSTPI